MNWSFLENNWFLICLYLLIAVVGIGLVYLIAPTDTTEQYRDFWTRVGVVLLADGVLINIIASKTTLNRQIQAAVDLENEKGQIVIKIEDYKKTILMSVEEKKKELSQEIEAVKGQIAIQNDFIKQTIGIKSVAYEKMFIASNMYYRQLQKLALGYCEEDKLDECEKAFIEAEALTANLDDPDIQIVEEMSQTILNIIDSIGDLKKAKPKITGEKLITAYQEIWNTNAKEFGKANEEFRKRSFYRNRLLNQLTEKAEDQNLKQLNG